MEAGFYCRTLKCLCRGLLRKILFGLPSFPSPQNADCCWSFVAMALCPQTRGQDVMGRQHGRLLAGRGTGRETTSVRGQPRHPPWKPQTSTANFERTLSSPVAQHPLVSHPRVGEKVWAGIGSRPGSSCFRFLRGFAVVQCLPMRHCQAPGRTLGCTPAPKVGGRAEQHCHTCSALRAPSPQSPLYQNNGSANTHGPHHRVPELPRHPRAGCQGTLRVRGAGGDLQAKEPGVAALSPCRDHRDTMTCWCCCSGHGICPAWLWAHQSRAFTAQPSSCTSSPPWQGRPKPPSLEVFKKPVDVALWDMV